MSASATMSDLLPTNFVGTTMAGVQNEDGKFRIYFQNKNYQLCEMQLNDPHSTTYNILNLTTSVTSLPAARINTPIAAVSWDDLRQIRVYYITVTSQVQEICYMQPSGGWQKGAHLGVAVENSTCLYAQHHDKEPILRVGFQSSTAPQTISEAYYAGPQSGWKTRVF